MTEAGSPNSQAITDRLRCQAVGGKLRVTAHAHQEMVEDGVLLGDLTSALRHAIIIEDYPDHRRGPCCLICGQDQSGQHLHVVCTTSLDLAVIITVYKPTKPKWKTPFKRDKTT